MSGLSDLTRKILREHYDPSTGAYEHIPLIYSSNEVASERLSRYIFASRFVYGVVLDCAAGSGYGSSILRRSVSVNFVVSVDIDLDFCKYGKRVYNIDYVCADATHLPFRERCFNSIISIETIEHIRNQEAFLQNVKHCLKQGGNLILTTPNKLYASPFLPKPLNPYHTKEYYLGSLLNLLKSHGFKVRSIYGGRRITRSELIKRVIDSFLKFFLGIFSIKPILIDNIYLSVSNSLNLKRKNKKLVDPDPSMFKHIELKTTSNIVMYRYFMIQSSRL